MVTKSELDGKLPDWKSTQNRDGGWAYARGSSWTEPTVLTLLAQLANTPDDVSIRAGAGFVNSMVRSDGGLRPQPGVEDSTWVTSVAALLPEELIGSRTTAGALAWLKGQTGQESGWRFRLQQRMAGNKDPYPEAWAWFPGAAAWAIPTTMGVLAFEKALKRKEDAAARRRVDGAREFLLTRQCADGGWNHGSNRALGRDGDSYPETTGLAMLAFAGTGRTAAITRAIAAARGHLAKCRTAEGISWLCMGLRAHGETAVTKFTPTSRNNMDSALLALAAAERNPLL
jgi:hypothetical protein